MEDLAQAKGTESELLCTQRCFSHFSIRAVLRAEVDKPASTYGPVIEYNMRHRRIGFKEITVALLKSAMLNHDTGPIKSYVFVIDGKIHRGSQRVLFGCITFLILTTWFPRKMDQAKYFEEIIAVRFVVILLNGPEKIMKNRLYLRTRFIGRINDNERTIEKRLGIFRTTTKVVLDKYELRHRCDLC